ncbi:MAG: MBOAT family protein [Clostridia bacterium]|nr:MBOAT family protein [Clostridia bacterium]
MVFSSLEFLFLYLPISLIIYFAVPFRIRNLVLLAVSLLFYGWGEPLYVFLMAGTIAIDYAAGYILEKNRQRGKLIVALTVVINLLILGFFKYYDFFIENIRLIPGLSGLKPMGLTLPIGISFYTFQALSYVIDVYRGDAKVQKSLAAFGAYVTLFPQLIAGPIVRYKDVDDQLREREHSVCLFASGLRTLIAGLSKKVLLANTAGAMWDSFSALPQDERTVFGAWLGIIFYSFQLYFDFSGYSDMAIGLGKMLGFKFLENFNYPYISKSITDFWRRWHISLSSWFREYLYIPLGGNRHGTLATYRNLLIVWLSTGFWHGASWNYLLWGLYYFILLADEKAFIGKLLSRLPKALGHIYALFFIVIGWLLFVSEDIGAGFVYLGNMFGRGAGAGLLGGEFLYQLLRNLPFILILALASTPLPKKIFWRLYERSSSFRWIGTAVAAVLAVVCIAFLVDSTYNPFLYFRF